VRKTVRAFDVSNGSAFTSIAAGLLLAVSVGDVNAEANTWLPRDQGPGRGAWSFAKPEDHGLSSSALAAASEAIGLIHGRQGLVVVRDGFIVHEQYWENEYHEASPTFRNVAFSAGKSWGSAMVGRAVTQGLFGIDDRVEDYHPPERSGLRRGTTVRHLLTMSSGGTLVYKPSSVRPVKRSQQPAEARGEDYRRGEHAEEGTPEGYAVSLEPGVAFHYDGRASDHLSNVVANAAGQPSHDYMWEHVLIPLGVESFQYQPQGIDSDGNVRIGGSIEMSVRDLARLGQLWLNQGVWGGEPLIDAAFVRQSVTPSNRNPDYGFLWWLSGRIEGAPESLFFASGAFGQTLYVLPDSNMVVATMGFSGPPRQPTPVQQIWDEIAPILPQAADGR
jgi:CubicO group peptidase (beta-lactamase class C family)